MEVIETETSATAETDPTREIPAVQPRPAAGGGATTVPDRGRADQPAPRRRRTRGVPRNSVFNVCGALAVGWCVAMLLFGRLAPFSGLIGFALVAYVVFLATYAVLLSLTEDRPAVVDGLVTMVLWSAALLTISILLDVILFTAWRGHQALVHLNFYTQDLSKTGPNDPLTSGGIKHAYVGTLWMIGIALGITVPLGLLGAVYLSETRGRLSRLVRTVVEAMTALPDIVAGLFIFLTWLLILHFQQSGLAAALALSIAMLPIIIRANTEVLRLVPGNLREASAALGAPSWRTTWHVVLPTARSGLTTGVILGAARGIGETAPVLLTAGYTTFLNSNPLHGPMVSLPLLAFTLVASGTKGNVTRGFAAATFLLAIVLVLFVIARVIGGRGPGQLTARKRRRIANQSARDVERIDAAAEQSPGPAV